MEVKGLPYEITSRPFEVKELTEQGVFTGYGSTFGGKPDSYGDVVVQGAFADTIRKNGRFGNGIKLPVHHDYNRPAGRYIELSENNKGIKVVGELALGTQDGKETYEFMKLGILNSLSIGWELLKTDSEGIPVPYEDSVEYDDKKNIRYLKKIDLWEISPVLFPANPRADITTVKCAIEEARTVRELEDALKEAGLSNNASKYIAGLVKYKFDLREEEQNPLRTTLKNLKILNTEMMVKGLVNKAINSTKRWDAETQNNLLEENKCQKH